MLLDSVYFLLCFVMDVFFFFKQKTAYEMRISDWSSDVCSSDLPIARLPEKASGRNSLPKTEGRRPDSQFFMMRYLWRLCSLQTRRSAERVTDGRNQPRNERSSDKGGRKPIFDRPTAISPVWFVVHPVGVTVRDFVGKGFGDSRRHVCVLYGLVRTNYVYRHQGREFGMPSVFDVAQYILAANGPMTTMKLQKLVYYSQAWSVVWDDDVIFDQSIQAWKNGPVVRELWEATRGSFRVHGIDAGNPAALSADHRATIDEVLAFYGERDAQWLSDLTHMEDPWKDAYAQGQNTDRKSTRL